MKKSFSKCYCFISDNLFCGYSLLYDIYKKISDQGERKIIEQYVKPGAVVVDIGANIGSYTLYLSKIVGENGWVHAFEPSPKNYSQLVKRTSSLKNVSINQVAVSSCTGTAKLYLSNTLDIDHRLYNTGDNRNSVDIDSIRLDDYFKKGDRVDFIKMDIQGFEYHVFLGMQELMKRNHGIKFIFEFWPFGLNAAGVVPLDLVSLLKQHGFNLYLIGKNKLIQFSGEELHYGFTKYFNIFASRECLI